MIYFGYPLDIHGWKTKPETEPDWFWGPELENRGWKTIPKPEPAEPETRGYPPQTQSVAILSPVATQRQRQQHKAERISGVFDSVAKI